MDQSLNLILPMVMEVVNASGMLTQLASFQLPSGNFTDNGMPDGLFVDVAGLTELPCKVSSMRFDRAIGSEVQTLARQVSTDTSYVLFGALYPQAETVWRNGGQLVIDGAVYPNADIVGVSSDSMGTHTSILLRTVSE